jgi:hypothetical protein
MIVDLKMVGFDGQPPKPWVKAAFGCHGCQQEKQTGCKKREIFQDSPPEPDT